MKRLLALALLVTVCSCKAEETLCGDGDELRANGTSVCVYSSPLIEEGVTYLVYLGGSSTGRVTDSLYSGGTYTPGTEVTSLTVEGILTTYGNAGMMGGGRQGGGVPGGDFPNGGASGGVPLGRR